MRITGIEGCFAARSRLVRRAVLAGTGLLLLLFSLMLSSPTGVMAQSRIVRGTFGAGGTGIGTETSRMHGTVSQSFSGHMSGETESKAFHAIGLWPRADIPTSEVVVSIPQVSAAVAERIRIPVRIESVDGRLIGETRSYSATIRYNASILESTDPQFVCERIGDTCFLELNGELTLTPGTITEIPFLAKLGNDTATDLSIISFKLEQKGEEANRLLTDDGRFTLLGVCVEGGNVRLIQAGPSGARLSLGPNPARVATTAQLIAAESGLTELTLFDIMGTKIATLNSFEAEAERVYTIELDLNTIPSGVYRVICRTPSETLTEQLMITQ